MTRTVRIAAFAHCSTLGQRAHEAAAELARPACAPGERKVLGEAWPWFAMAVDDADWSARACTAITRVGSDLAAALPAPDWADTPLFVASSSLQMGALEHAARASGTTDMPPDAAAFPQQVADWLGIAGTPWTVSTTCTSGFAAIDAAASLIRQGVIDRALVIGIELANDTTLAGFAGLGLLARQAGDKGLVLGEAVAGVLLRANADSGWELAACRLGVDGHSPTGPAPDGRVIRATMDAALADAGLRADDIDLLKLHGGDLAATAEAESCAVSAVFGDARPATISFKHRLGHTLGASGVAELSLLLAVLDGKAQPPQHILLNLVGFGGSIGALVLRASPDAPPAQVEDTGADEGTRSIAANECARIALAFDSAELNARARAVAAAISAPPLRRAGALAELCLAGVDACAPADEHAGATAILVASRSGPRQAFARVLEDLCLRSEAPMPFDFLATQAVLAALPVQKRLPGLDAFYYLPGTDDSALLWQRMAQLASAWLACGRHRHVLIGIVEPGAAQHRCEWRRLGG
ncbi:hypothetical protein CEW87_07555 [Parazoarcus communis]|uniref:Ketosynthase family 3 (KS3) domain-containing protein n=1 Tax=Parazoarcus communis TaxID=41977 RepID=A0A2U8GZU3_9RHOO|nr:beta-ketoacyl synthase N-terminal-like domain-containing protein [Parazoarcus communis]AWI79232.1 hypothetical protein CEW87_07555 [Parazoarcus communis]